MTGQRSLWGKRWPLLLVAVVLCALAYFWHSPLRTHSEEAKAITQSVESSPQATWEPPDILVLPPGAVASMKLSAVPAVPSTEPQTLRLTGKLTYDPNELVHVNTRFAGEVIRIGEATGLNRPLRSGDRVQKGQLLAIVWSKEIGEKKSDLVEALSQMALHEALYKNLKKLEKSGAVPQRAIDEMEKEYESDLIRAERYRRTLRSWKIDESELAEIEREAEKFHEQVLKQDEIHPPLDSSKQVDDTWAEIDIKAPLNGVILEKNLTVGDIVETDDDLFKIADLSRLVVMANLYEDDLSALLSLPADKRTWEIRLTADRQSAPIAGTIEMIGNVIDPNQHTVLVQGYLDNSSGNLRVGQFVEALVPLPSRNSQIEIPLAGLIDQGSRKFVLVALDDDLTRVQRQAVIVDRRTERLAYVRGDGPHAVQPGERIFVNGVLELSNVLDAVRPADFSRK